MDAFKRVTYVCAGVSSTVNVTFLEPIQGRGSSKSSVALGVGQALVPEIQSEKYYIISDLTESCIYSLRSSL